jgi:preprotein translocase subunit SecE
MKEKIINYVNDISREMKKVTWPSKDELKESTSIVVILCIILSIFTWVIDLSIQTIIKGIF